MIPKQLRVHAQVLSTLARAKPKVLVKQIKQLSPDVVRTIKDIAKNYLKGSIKINKRQIDKLRRHKRSLQELALRKTSLKRSKKILQKGGFIATLIAPLISLFANLLTK